jgi:tetratricopeptide (TPR) repeat protein
MEYERSIQAAGRAIGAFGELGDPRRVAESQLFMGASLGLLRRTAEGEEVLYRAIDAFQALNARRYVAAAFQYLALARLCADDVEGSRPFFAQALEIYRATPGAERPASRTAGLLAEAEFQSGDPGKALKLITEALASDRARDDKYAIVYDLCNSAAYLIALERIDEARSIAGEALSLALKTHEPWSITLAVQHIAAIVLRQDARLAAQLLGFVDGRIAEVSGRRDFTEQREYDFALALLRESLPADELAALLSDGSSWPAERAIAAASSVAVREGHP